METKVIRDSNFELLRIISIIIIIMHHFAYHNVLYMLPFSNYNLYIGLFLFSLGKIAVTVFILISGYFMINKKISIKKIILLWMEVEFYIILMTLVTTLIKGAYPFKIKDTIKLLMPIVFNKYWFITAYMGLYVISPLINKIVLKLTKKKFNMLIKINFIVFIVIYSFMHGEQFITTGSNLSVTVLFCFLYMVGAYIKLNDIDFLKNRSKLILSLYLLIALVLYYAILIIVSIYFKNIVIDYYIDFKFILVFVISILIFYIFKKTKINNSKIINNIAASVFGIYLFQSHPLFGGKFLYKELIHSTSFYNSKLLVLYILVITVFVFLAGVFIDKIRKVVEKPICNSKMFNNFIANINERLNKKIGDDYFE